jgi:hypothetical protein
VADLTKAQLRNRVLQHLGVLGAGQTANAEDADLVDEAIDAAHERLRKLGLVPFATSAVPPWAQIPLRDFVAGDVAQAFGMSGQRLAEFKRTGDEGERELRRQVAGFRHPMPIVADYF